MTTTIIVTMIGAALLAGAVDKFVTYGKENELYEGGYLND